MTETAHVISSQAVYNNYKDVSGVGDSQIGPPTLSTTAPLAPMDDPMF